MQALVFDHPVNQFSLPKDWRLIWREVCVLGFCFVLFFAGFIVWIDFLLMEGVGREGKRRWDCSHLPSGKPCNLAQLGTLHLSWSSCWALLGWLSTSRASQKACRMPGVGGCIWPSTWLKQPRSHSQRRWWAKLTLYCCVVFYSSLEFGAVILTISIFTFLCC